MTTQELNQAATAAEQVIVDLEAGRVRKAREGAHTLDAVVQEREVQLRSLAGQGVAAKAAAGAAAGAWEAARAAVIARAGDPLVERFDLHVARLQRHEGPAHIREEAGCGIGLLAALRRAAGSRAEAGGARAQPAAVAA